MTERLYCVDIEATLEDGTTIKDGKGYLINNQRVHKDKDGNELVGTKKIKTVHRHRMLMPPQQTWLFYKKNKAKE